MRKPRKLVLGAALLAAGLVLAACGSGEDGTTPGGSPASPKGTITIGVSGAFAENQLVAEMYAQVLEKAGYTVKRQLDLGGREVSDAALFGGQIDLKPEYLAFELPKLDANADTKGTAEQVYPRLQQAAEAKDLVALQFSPANSTNVFIVTPETAQKDSLTKMSDLAPVASQLVLGAPPDCDTNFACKEGLQQVYGITFKEIKSLDFGGPQTVAAIESGAVDVGELFSLDPTITQKGWTVLEDDKDLQPAGNFFPLVRKDKVTTDLTNLLNSVTTKLTTDGMLALVGKVQVDKEDVKVVATQFLKDSGLL
ncbi:MAG TPA: ABC transporter substrate-binding protein [Actinomycetota bacterium]|nr:ABC transporter substrate-binding protein [Actinomycetota bacterium]